jgi:hypothetical protein
VLVLIYSGFWLTSSIGNILITSLAYDNAVTKVFYTRLIAQWPRLATVLNAPVLYFCRYYKFVPKFGQLKFRLISMVFLSAEFVPMR